MTAKPSEESNRLTDLKSKQLRVAPSLLAADFCKLREQVALVEDAGAEVLHLDVMDGHFVPNISFGPAVIAQLRPFSNMFFDTHLMITEPARYAEAFANAGSDLITFHIEVTDNPDEVIDEIRKHNCGVGVSINPTTEVDSIEAILSKVDLVLVMSVWPGFGGQSFIADVLTKVKQLRERLRDDQRLEIDGGISLQTIAAAATAGVDTFVAGTSVFGDPDPAAAFEHLMKAAYQAVDPSK
ncbi:MAG: ribulose-phosphate 3-epimerase [Phycisphaerae bacterium]|nr:MAG: ribulose-phosphate 3-epimerase [Phycisphaerae bacterium]